MPDVTGLVIHKIITEIAEYSKTAKNEANKPQHTIWSNCMLVYCHDGNSGAKLAIFEPLKPHMTGQARTSRLIRVSREL